ncbi:MAG: ribosome maturation factor RimM [Pseudolabrys sp.]|nr:ribosome maturation factor RimM [Pseudolabrys sp.]
MAEKVCIARIGAAHGVRGEVKLWPFTEDPAAVTSYGPLETADGKRTFDLEIVRAAKDHLIARIKGIADRDAAAALTNLDLYVPRERLPAIAEPDTFYHSDLIGLDAIREDGSQVGTVHAIHNFGAGDVVEITPTGSGEPVMLPFNEATVPRVDLAKKQIVVVPPAEIEAREDE